MQMPALILAKPRVDFLVIGAQKAGTTALHAQLQTHPQLFLPELKELHFFDIDSNFGRFRSNAAAYEAHFEDAEGRVRGEITPIYLYWRQAAPRIRRYNPGMKMVAVLRDPIDRAYSHWAMEHARGDEPLGFSEAIRAEPERLARAPFGQHRIHSYAARGDYADQIERFRALFGAGSLLPVKYEDLLQRHETEMARVFGFLGVDPGWRTPNLRRHVGGSRPPMSEADRAFLVDRFRDGVGRLEKMLGWDCSDWLDRT